MGVKYKAHALIGDGTAALWLDDRLLEKVPVNFLSGDGDLSGGYSPSYLNGPAEYQVVQSDLRVISDSDHLEHVFELPKDRRRFISLRMLNPIVGAFKQPFKPTKSVDVEVSFEFAPALFDPVKVGPLVDRYGQAVAADFPGKVADDQQLVDATADEERLLKHWPKPGGYDRFGGYIGSVWHQQATGFYRVEKRGKFWWLISPAGNPCFYVGLCDAPCLAWNGTPVNGRRFMFEHLPPREGQFAEAWKMNIWETESPDAAYFIFHVANLIDKYGGQWKERANSSTLTRLEALGFSGFGKWCEPLPGHPFVPVIFPSGIDKLTAHPDPWDPRVRRQVRAWLEKEVEPRRDDPFIVGWSIGNEREAFPDLNDVRKVLASTDGTPAKQAMLAFAKLKGINPTSAEGAERLRLFYEDALFDLYYRTIKDVDPHHLYLGNWVTPNWWIDSDDWGAIAKHCDVIGFDRYARSLDDPAMDRLLADFDKPALCGEFSFPADYGGRRGYGTYSSSVETERESGDLYRRWISDAAAHPRIIGALYFEYRDEPILGRGPGAGGAFPVLGENYAFGLVDVTDRLKFELCQSVREANLQAVTTRLELSDQTVR
jgi:hypothetical protein